MWFPSDSWGKYECAKPKNEKVLKRVRLLYNLANNGGDPNGNEAQSALQLANKLMAENKIEEWEV